MKKIVYFAFVLLSVSTVGIATVENAASADDLNKKIKSGKVVVKLHAIWCGACKALTPVFEEVSNEISGVKFVSFDVDKDPARTIARKYVSEGLPTVVFFVDGKEKGTQVGFSGKDKLKNFIQDNGGSAAPKKAMKRKKPADEEEAVAMEVEETEEVVKPKKSMKRRKTVVVAPAASEEVAAMEVEEAEVVQPKKSMKRKRVVEEVEVRSVKRVKGTRSGKRMSCPGGDCGSCPGGNCY